jgi:hypothetical protein
MILDFYNSSHHKETVSGDELELRLHAWIDKDLL